MKNPVKFVLCLLLLAISFPKLIAKNENIQSLEEAYNQADKEKKGEIALKIALDYGTDFPDLAFIWCQRAHTHSENSINKEVEAKTLYHLSEFEFLLQRFEDAAKTAEKANSILQKTNFEKSDIHLPLLYRLAECYEYTTRHQSGMQIYQKCYDIATNLGDIAMLTKLDIKFANMHQVNRNFLATRKYYISALNRMDQKANKNLYYKTLLGYYNFAVTTEEYFTTEEKEAICKDIAQSVKIIEQTPELSDLLMSFQDLQLYCILMQKDNQNIHRIPLLSLTALNKETTNINSHHRRLQLYTKIAIAQNNFAQAKIYSDKNYEFLSITNSLGIAIEVLQLRKIIFTKSGQYKKALELIEKLNACEAELKSSDRMIAIAGIETKLDSVVQAHQLMLINKENEYLKANNWLFFLSSIIFAILSLLASFFFYRSKKKNQIIAEKNQQLHVLNTTKDRIFAIIGHDLRKPALAFRGISKKINYLLKDNNYQTLNLLGEEIEKDALSLNKLIDNLLKWALMQRNVMPYNPETILLKNMVQEVCDLFKNTAKKKNITITVHIFEAIEVYADQNALNAIIRNLLDNALKYTPHGGQIEIDALTTASGVKLAIKDTGIGIPEEKMKDIFLIEMVKSKDGTIGEKGTGLGLQLVKELVALNKGMIGVVSEKGQGTCFNIQLPKNHLQNKINSMNYV